MTLTFLERCSVAVFVALGQSKAAALKQIFVDRKPLPAALVKSKSVVWLLDSESAGLIPEAMFE